MVRAAKAAVVVEPVWQSLLQRPRLRRAIGIYERETIRLF